MTFDDFNLSKNADGLLPAIVQDDTTLKVEYQDLMLKISTSSHGGI